MSDTAVLALAPVAVRRSAAADAVTLTARSLRLASRNVDALISALALPIVLLLVFVYLFGGAIDTGTAYVTYIVPGVLLLCAGFGASSTAVTVSNDLSTAVIDRFRSLDVSGPALLGGHVGASLVRNSVSTAIVLGVAFAIGFRPHAGPLAWLGAAGILALAILAVSWLATVAGLLARTPEAAGGFTFLVMFLPYPSSAFVPVDTLPSWLRGFAENQPFTPVIESLRGLLLDQPVGAAGWHAAAWCGGTIVVSMVLAAVLFRRRSV